MRTFPVFADSVVTAAELRRLGFKNVSAAKDDAADLARLVERSAKPANGALIYACSTAAPINLSAMLSNMGFAVRQLPLYTLKRVDELPSALRDALQSKTVDAALFLSADEARAFVALVQRAEAETLVQKLVAVAANPVVAAPLRALKLGAVSVPSSSDLDAIFASLDGALVDKVEEERLSRAARAREDEERLRGERERIATEQAERERIAREQVEKERIEQEHLARKQAAEKTSREKAERKRLEDESRERAAREKVDRERLERERRAAEKAAQERVAAEKAAQEKASREKLAAERAEQERVERDRRAAEKAERERVAAEKTAQDTAERERQHAEQAEKDKIERERLAAEKIARERIAAEKAAQEQAERERQRAAQAEKDRIDRERLAAEKVARDRVAAEQIAQARSARERLELEKAEHLRQEQERQAAERAERERLAREKAAAERMEQERLAAEKAEHARIERERLAAERTEQERIAREKAEAEPVEREHLAAEKAERDRIERERLAAERAEQERIAREKAETERAERERLATEKTERDRIERERQAQEKAERERLAREVAEKEKAEAARVAQERTEERRREKVRQAQEKAEQKAERLRIAQEQKALARAAKAAAPPRQGWRARVTGWVATRRATFVAPGPVWDTAAHAAETELPDQALRAPPSGDTGVDTVSTTNAMVNDAPSATMVPQHVAAPEPEIIRPEPETAPEPSPEHLSPHTKEIPVSEQAPQHATETAPPETSGDAKTAARSGGRAGRLLAEDAADLRAKDQRFKYLGHSGAPEADAAAQTASAALPRRRGLGRTVLLLAVVVAVAATVIGTADRWVPRVTGIMRGSAQTAPLAATEGAASIQADISALKARVGVLEQKTVGGVTPDALNVAKDARGEAVTSLSDSVSSQAKQLAAVSARLATLEAAIGNAARLEDLSKRLNMLEGRSAEAHSVLALSDRVTALETTGRRTMVQQSGSIALLMATAQWREAVLTGRPFAAELETVKALAARNDLPIDDSGFADMAARGLPTLQELQRQFGPTAAAATRASAIPDSASAWYRRILDRILSIVTIRRLDGDAAGTSTSAVLARAEQRLTESNLAAATREMEALQGGAATAASAWLSAAKMCVAAEKATTDITTKAVAALTAASKMPGGPAPSAPASKDP